jgi:hypothetical protein
MNLMRKRVVVGTIVGASLIFASGPVFAGAPVGECPTPEWELRAEPQDASGAPSVDVNGNGLSCYLEAPKGSGVFTVIDDVVRSRHT